MATWTKRAGVSMTTNVGGFYEFLPTGYNGTTQFPCLIFFHGSGERGNGNSQLDTILGFAVPKWINARMGTGSEFPFPCIVICPQYATGVYPGGFLYQNVINYIKTNYAVDTSKIYLSGWSMGGSFMDEWGDVGTITDLAALSPIAGVSYYNSSVAARYKSNGMPMWFLHGTGDGVIEWERSRDWVNGLNGGTALVPAPRITYDPESNPRSTPPSTGGIQSGGDPHNIADFITDWTQFTLSGQTWYEWLLDQSRATSASGLSNGVAAVTGSANIIVKVTGSSAGTATAVAAVTGTTLVTGSSAGSSSVSGTAVKILKATGSAAGIGGTEGQRYFSNVGTTTDQVIDGNNWVGLQDAYVTGGVNTDVFIIWGSDQTITGTTNPTIYKSQRRTSIGITIAYPYADGSYTLRLHFCEFWKNTSGNVFNVTVEGTQIITGLDVWSAAGGRYKAIYYDFPVTISGGVLNMSLTPTLGDAMLNAFEIISQTTNATVITGVSGTSGGIASASGQAAVTGFAGATTDGTSTATATAKVINIATGQQIDGTSTATANARASSTAAASTEGSSSISGNANAYMKMSGTSSGTAFAAANDTGTTEILATGTAAAASTVTGNCIVIAMADGRSQGSSDAYAPSLSIAGTVLSGNIQTTIDSGGNIQTSINLDSRIAI